jgi:flavin-binding protein dodecin
MSVAKVIEVTASSEKSFEDAIERGITKAGESVHGIKGAWISEQKVRVDDEGKITEYRVYMRLTFILDD